MEVFRQNYDATGDVPRMDFAIVISDRRLQIGSPVRQETHFSREGALNDGVISKTDDSQLILRPHLVEYHFLVFFPEAIAFGAMCCTHALRVCTCLMGV
jgi:hypothetical protein